MHVDAILEKYNPENRCVATYVDQDGLPARGLLLDPPQKSISGNWFVFVTNYATRILVENIINVQDTKVRWA